MATITSTPTFPQVEGILRKDFFRKFLGETGLGSYGTATGGTTTTIVDTSKLQSTQYDSKDHVGGWARIGLKTSVPGTAPEGEQNPITTYTPSTGTITNNPAFTVAPLAGDQYEIWRGVNPADAKDILDSLLVNDIAMPCWTILTEIPDGDMEQPLVQDWANVTATVDKQTAEPVMYGKRYLRVLALAGNGYAKTNSDMNVEPNRRYHLSAIARCSAAATTAKLQAFDVTNGAEIASRTSTFQFNHRIHFEFSTPSTCNLLSVRLITVENGQTTYWDEVCLYPLDTTDIRLPWWVKNKNQVIGTMAINSSDIYSDIWDWVLKGEPDYKYYVQDSSQGQLRVQCREGTIGGSPLFILGLRNETAYSNDSSDKKYVEQNLLFNAFGYKIYALLYQRNINNNIQALKMKEMRDTFYANWKRAEAAQMESLNRIFAKTTTPDMFIDDNWARFSYGRR